MRKSPPNYRAHGFTLIELLVVIAIIGILAGLMFPATTGALRRAERTHAENTCYNLKNAVSAYFTEYRKYPVDPNRGEQEELRTDTQFMSVLLGADNADAERLNPRKIAFYSGKAAKPAGAGRFRKGVRLQADGSGELYDPWIEAQDNFYFLRLDLDYNNRVERPQWDQGDARFLPESILVWSAGRDGDETQAQDNIKTW